MKLPLSIIIFALLFALAQAQTLIKDIAVTGTGNQVRNGAAWTAKSGSTTTFESGATLNLGNATITWPTTGVAAGTYGSATQSLTATVDASGRLTSLAAQTVTPAFVSLTGKPTTLAGYGIADSLTSAQIAAGYQPLDSDLTAIAALATTSYGRSTLSLADAAAGRAYFGLVIGTNVQAWSANLDSLAAQAPSYYLSRANHTGTQAISTVTGLQTALDGKLSSLPIASAGTLGGIKVGTGLAIDGAGVLSATGGGGGGAVASVFGRTGIVVAQTGDYTASQVGADSTGTAAAAVAAHVAAGDPHTQYTTTSEAAAAAPVQSVAGRTGVVTLAAADISGLGAVASSSSASDLTVGTLAAARLPSEAVTLAGAQTLTNKTLTSPTINGGAISSAVTVGQANGIRLDGLAATRLTPQAVYYLGVSGDTLFGIPVDGAHGFTIIANFILSGWPTSDSILVDGPVSIYTSSDGSLRIYQREGTGTSLYVSAGGLVVAGVPYQLVYSRGVGLYLNGALVSAVADTYSYTTAHSIIGGNVGNTGSFFAGALRVAKLNRSLSAPEIAMLWTTGTVSSSTFPTVPAGTVLVTGDDSTFNSDTGFWAKGAGADINSTTAGQAHLSGSSSYISKTGLLVAGNRYRATVTITAISGSVYFGGLSTSGDYTTHTTTGTKTWEFTAQSSGSFGLQLVPAGGSCDFDDLTLTPVGAVYWQDPYHPGTGLAIRSLGNTLGSATKSASNRWVYPASPGTSTSVPTLLTVAPASGWTWSNMPAAETHFLGSAKAVTKVDLTYASSVRLTVLQSGTAASGATLKVRYRSGSFSTTAGDYSDIGTTSVGVTLSAGGSTVMLDSGWVDLATPAKGDVYVSVIGAGGDGAADPGGGFVVIQIK